MPGAKFPPSAAPLKNIWRLIFFGIFPAPHGKQTRIRPAIPE
jgi:hypothetical protein